MNRVQEAIARVTGVDQELQGVWRAYETVVSANTMLERQIEDLDYLNLYDFDSLKEVLPNANSDNTIKRLRRLRHENPLAKQGVKLIVRFTLGKGIQWMVKEKSLTAFDQGETDDSKPVGTKVQEAQDTEALRQAIAEFWGDPENQMTLTEHSAQQTWLDENVTDGEKFLVLFDKDGVAPYTKLSEIPLEEVKDILYDPNNRKRPVWYKRVYVETRYDAEHDQWIPDTKPTTKYYRDFRVTDEDLEDVKSAGLNIPESKVGEGKVQHWMINPLYTKNGKRGISELYASREWFRVFKEFMQDRASINASATAIAYKRKIKGGPADVARFSGRLGAIDNTDTDPAGLRKLTRPVAGAIYDSNLAADLEWNKTDTGAAQAREDARLLLMSAGAGMSTNIHYFGEGGDANLATAQAMELPMVKSYEDWQKYFESNMMALLYHVIKVAFGEDYEIPRDTIVWEFPPIISKDIVKLLTAWSTLTGQIAKDDKVVRLAAIRGALNDLDVPGVDQLMKEIEEEEAKLEKQRDEMRENNPLLNGNGNGKTPIPGFAKANAAGGGNPETARLAKNKPPIERPGRSPGVAGS